MTTQTKHTTGPWALGTNAYSEYSHAICAPAGHPMDERVIGIVYGPDSERSQADARLIAASPELLAACQAALLRDDIADSELGDQLRAAVAKATAA